MFTPSPSFSFTIVFGVKYPVGIERVFAGAVARAHCDMQFVYFFKRLTFDFDTLIIFLKNKDRLVFGHGEKAVLFFIYRFFLDDYASCAFAFVHFVAGHFHHSPPNQSTRVINGFIIRIADRLYLQEIRVLVCEERAYIHRTVGLDLDILRRIKPPVPHRSVNHQTHCVANCSVDYKGVGKLLRSYRGFPFKIIGECRVDADKVLEFEVAVGIGTGNRQYLVPVL